MAELKDLNDGKDWSEMDVFDLHAATASGDAIERIARHLCRATTIDEVKAKARELGLTVRLESEPRRVDVAYTDGHWLAQLGPDDASHFDCGTLQKLIEAVQAHIPDEPLLFVVDHTTIEYYVDAESQFIDAAEKSGALVISSTQEF